MSARRYDCVVFEPGPIFFDMVFTGLPSMPRLGEEIFAKSLTLSPGGAFNSAAAMARLGLKVALVARIGEDFFSRFIEARLKAEGIDTRYLMREPGNARAITVSMTFPTDRAFVSYVDGEDAFDFPEALLDAKRTRLLFVPHHVKHANTRSLIAKAQQAGIPVAVDPHLPWGDIREAKVRESLFLADILLPNSREACLLSATETVEEALEKLRAFSAVAIKNGGEGSLAWRAGEQAHVKALKSKVVDTTGAGDCFNAGFLSGVLDECPLNECLARGNACGGLAVRHAGGAEGAPDRETMLAEAAKLLGAKKRR